MQRLRLSGELIFHFYFSGLMGFFFLWERLWGGWVGFCCCYFGLGFSSMTALVIVLNHLAHSQTMLEKV